MTEGRTVSRTRVRRRSRAIVALFAAFAALVLALPATAATSGANVQRDPGLIEPVPSCTVSTAKELFITDVSVVDDCFRTTWTGTCPTPIAPATRGAWTFGKLIQGLAGSTNASTLNGFVRRWLNQWNNQQTINSDVVPPRTNIQSLVITPWENASGSTTLDMTKAPFRLLAIVFRFDLRDASGGYTGANTAGEARFVFGVLDGSGNTTLFTTIFEYGLDVGECADIQAWAQAAHSLGSLPFGDDYNAALQSITDQFTAIGASPNKINGSAINQVRTNEFALGILPWELREFHLKKVAIVKEPIPVAQSVTAGFTTVGDTASALPGTTTYRIDLAQSTVAQTPDRDLQGQQIIADYINTNESAILANQHVVPLSFQSTAFRGGAAPNPQTLGWDGPGSACSSINNDEARFNFSLNTCSGCHGQDTGTSDFLHVHPRLPGVATTLSNFLNGGSATDKCGLSHNFGDLERRRLDLCTLLTETCTQIEAEEPANFVH